MTIFNNYSKRLWLVLALVALVAFAAQAFGQGADASLGGTIVDADNLVLPGVTVTATNVNTNVKTTALSNNSGVYNFPSLQPGTYTVSADLDGFKKNTKTDVSLGGTSSSRLDFQLEVAGIADVELEVVTTAQDILTESSSSTGTVLRSEDVTELPLTSNDVLELINIMGGVTPASGDIFGRTDQTFAGVDTNGINIQQDGLTINDVRYSTGIASSSRINTEMVQEFKLILSPVDAELGRGAGQVQILTKSGANSYHGSGVWNITNSALDANSWSNNRTGTPLEWRNLNTYTLTFSGPIKKNKTFFFLTWDHAIPRTHSNRTPVVLTNCARKGIFRYFEGWNNGNFDANVTPTGQTPTRPVVDVNGVPLDARFSDQLVGLNNDDVQIITTQPDGETPSSLQFVSVFGPLTDTAKASVEADLINCSQYDPYAGSYDMFDPTSTTSMETLGISRYYEDIIDPDTSTQRPIYRVLDTRAIPNFSSVMPEANWFRSGDGLNQAALRWTRSNKGVDNIYGVGEENARKNISVKIDHNFNDRHRISGNWTYERDVNASASKLWPNGYAGTTERTPQRYSVTVTSSLRPTILNEARFGLNRNLSHSLNAVDATETYDEIRSLMQSMLPTNDFVNFPAGEPFVFNPLGFGTNAPYQSHFIGGRDTSVWAHAFLPSFGGYDHRWMISDTLTWTKGRHSLKFGGEIRLVRSHQDSDGDFSQFLSRLSMPTAFGGVQEFSLPDDLSDDANAADLPGLVGTQSFFPFGSIYLSTSNGTYSGLQTLRDYMAGSMSHIWQWFFINDPFEKDWNDINEGEITRIVDIRQKEMAFFAKDDWKVNNNLTLNLGLRWEYYGVPYMDRGMTLGLQGGSNAIFGVSGRNFNGWMPQVPVNLGDEYLTVQEFIGPGSPQPEIDAFQKDFNNIGPAVGFAWQLPWFGRGKTTVRGGYQLSYSQISNAGTSGGGFSNVLAGSTGTNFDYYYSGTSELNRYMHFAELDSYLPTKKYLETEENPIVPLETLDIKNREADLTVYDYNIVNPYTQSLNLSVSRQIGSKVTLDVRYIGTLGRKGVGSLDLNSNNWLSNDLINVFDAARRGENPELLDKLFEGIQFSGIASNIAVGAPGGPTGGDVLRNLSSTQTALAEGDYNSIAGTLNMLNYDKQKGGCLPWNPSVCNPAWEVFWPGLNSSLPSLGTLEDGSVLRHADTLYPGEFPENFIVANPQLGAANWYTNLNHNNYHSLQVQFTLRPTHGFNLTSTYTWSKNLGNSNYTNPNDRTNPFDYTWTGNTRQHQLNAYGQMTLPFGANGFFFRDVSNPIVRRLIEGWEASFILRLNSGNWTNISADATHLYGNSVPNFVRPDLFDPSSGHVTWEAGARNGYYFGDPNKYMFGPDLQCLDQNLVQATWEYNSDLQRNVLNADASLRDECMDNMSAMYLPMYETVTQLAYIDPNDPSLGVEEVTFDRPVYSSENVIFQHPMPGEYGNYGRNKVMGPGSFSLDMALGKTVQLTEGKSIGFRMDAGNILNHPSPGGPNFSVSDGGNPLGYIGGKNGQRRFQAKITLRF